MLAEILTLDAITLDNGDIVELPTKLMEFVDDKQRIISKLSPIERKILGLEQEQEG